MRKRKRKYKGKTIQRERRIFHGDYLTVHIFPVFKKAGKRRKKSKPSSEVQTKLNQKYREEKLTYMIDENFGPKDLELGLGFDDEHLSETYTGVQKAVRNYIRRMRRYRTTHNLPELKYIYAIERGQINGRWHIHMITNGGIDRDLLEKMWGQGYAHTFRLEFDDEGIKGLAKYIVKEPETENTVRNICEGNICEDEIERLYKSYTVTSVEPFFNNVNAGEYLTIRLRKTQSSRIPKQSFFRRI